MSAASSIPNKKSYLNWGNGIALTIFIAASAMVFLVYKSMKVNFDMVTQDYYAQELIHNDKMKAVENANSLSTPIKVEQMNDVVVLAFPKECIKNGLNGNVLFYRPSDASKDVALPIKMDRDGLMVVATQQLSSGNYKAQIQWTSQNVPYFQEIDVMIK